MESFTLAVNLNTILSGLIVAGTSWMGKLCWDIREQLVKQNGRIGKVEQWQELHTAQCNERYEDLRGSLLENQRNLNILRHGASHE